MSSFIVKQFILTTSCVRLCHECKISCDLNISSSPHYKCHCSISFTDSVRGWIKPNSWRAQKKQYQIILLFIPLAQYRFTLYHHRNDSAWRFYAYLQHPVHKWDWAHPILQFPNKREDLLLVVYSQDCTQSWPSLQLPSLQSK